MKKLWWLAPLFLVGCVSFADPPTREEAPPLPPAPAKKSVDLSALREKSGVPDCPDTDLKAASIANGLPQTNLQCLGSAKRVNLAGLRGQRMVIVAWAQWCPPCRAEAPILREVADSTDIMFLGINSQDPQPDWALEFAGLSKWRFPHVVDDESVAGRAMRMPGLPTTVFVDERGVVVGKHPGPYTSAAELKADIAKYLGDA